MVRVQAPRDFVNRPIAAGIAGERQLIDVRLQSVYDPKGDITRG